MGFWSRCSKYRTWVQLASAVFLNSWFTQQVTRGIPCPAFNCYACPIASFACPIGSIQNSIGLRAFPWYVLGFVGLVGALGGRFACGWFCPFGWLQELLYKIPVPKWRVQLHKRAPWWVLLVATMLYGIGAWVLLPLATTTQWLYALYLTAGFVLYVFLGVSRLFALIALVLLLPLIAVEPWFCKLCPAGTLEGGIPQVVLYSDLRALVGPLFWLKIAILIAFLAWMTITRRPFCRWMCPLGALWSPLNRWSTLQMTVDQDTCICCNRCEQVCPVDIRIYQDVDTEACVRCMECVAVCPESCIQTRAL